MNRTHSKAKAILAGATALLLVASLSPIKTSAATPHMKPAPAPMVAAQNDALDFDIVNATGYEIKEVLIAPSASADWHDDDDVLQGRPFPDGSTLHISFSPKAAAEHWDIRVTYSIDNTYKEFDGLNLTKISKVTLHWDADAQKTRADIE
jgi:hypothetical protein